MPPHDPRGGRYHSAAVLWIRIHRLSVIHSFMATAGETMQLEGLRVGVTGHRPDRLARADLPELRAQVAEVLSSLQAGIRGQVTLISALAEGADQLAAEVAVAAGLRWVCPLPFPLETYDRDFSSGGALRSFRTLLAQAAEVEELPGSRGSPDTEAAAYAAVGVRIGDRADVLLAIWDGAPSRGAGGTADVVGQARRAGVPAVWIAATPPHRVTILAADSMGTGNARTALEALRTHVEPPSPAI